MIYDQILNLVAGRIKKPVFMSTLFNLSHQNSHFLVVFVLKISPLIYAPPPIWKISRPRGIYYERYGTCCFAGGTTLPTRGIESNTHLYVRFSVMDKKKNTFPPLYLTSKNVLFHSLDLMMTLASGTVEFNLFIKQVIMVHFAVPALQSCEGNGKHLLINGAYQLQRKYLKVNS